MHPPRILADAFFIKEDFMKIIQYPDSLFLSLFGNQKIKNEKYRISRFTYVVDFDKGIILYNTLTKELLFLEDFKKEYLSQNSTQNKNVEIVKYLINKWFLVPEKFDENFLYEQFFTVARTFSKKDGIGFYKILTTNDCNARCFYCYKADVEKIYMDQKTAKKTAEFIIDNCNNKAVHLYWFGGEPLCNTEVIDQICNYLTERNIKFHSTFITNGYLFEEDIVYKAKNEWHTDLVQITLDGTAEIYKKCKAYIVDDDNPFEKVINNIENILKCGIKLFIRINMDKHNISDLYNLVNLLIDRFNEYNLLKIYPVLLSEEFKVTHRGFEKADIVDEFLKLQKYIFEKGKLITKRIENKLKINSCMADDDGSVVILPNGDLARCDLRAKESVYGNVFLAEKEDYSDWRVLRQPTSECFSCILRPMCVLTKKCRSPEKKCDKYERKIKYASLRYSMINRCQDFLKGESENKNEM